MRQPPFLRELPFFAVRTEYRFASGKMIQICKMHNPSTHMQYHFDFHDNFKAKRLTPAAKNRYNGRKRGESLRGNSAQDSVYLSYVSGCFLLFFRGLLFTTANCKQTQSHLIRPNP